MKGLFEIMRFIGSVPAYPTPAPHLRILSLRPTQTLFCLQILNCQFFFLF